MPYYVRGCLSGLRLGVHSPHNIDMTQRETAQARLTRLTGLRIKDRVRVTVRDASTGTGQPREITATITSSQVHEIPASATTTEPWGTVCVKELGVNQYHAVDHRAVTKIGRAR
jgi:hypothetical protein